MTDTTAKPASPGLVARGALIATAFAAVLAFVAYLATPNSPYAPKAQSTTMKIQEITSKSGLKAWLVEEHSVPLMAMRFAFDGGSAQDPTGKEGAANFLTGMLDEGAGDLDSQTFQSRMEEIAMHMSFEDGKDNFYGSFETLTENRTAAVELLKLAINKPRFDKDAVERVRAQLQASLVYAARDPDRVANKVWMETAYAGHPYGRPSSGTTESLKAVEGADLETYRRRMFAKDTLRLVLVGDITASDASALIDAVFADLPAKAEMTAVPPVQPKLGEKLKVVEMAVPQSSARIGGAAMLRKDPDFMAAYVLNHILGGGGFSSRLMEEVREKRGLAYSVYSFIQPMKQGSVFMGGVATKNEEVGQSLDVISGELKRITADGPTARELEGAKSNLTGSFALRFDTNAKIANQLLYFLGEGFAPDYVEKRNAEVDAVTLDDVKRVAKRLFEKNEFLTVIVGKPKNLPGKS